MEIEVPEYSVAPDHSVDPDDSILLVVDMQRDFAHEDGALHNPEASDTIPTIVSLIESARDAEVPVWYTLDTHTEDDPEFQTWGEHCVKGTSGWEVVDELSPADDDRTFEKSRYDGFYGTQLEHQLQVNDRDTLVICGTVANICVHYTAASAGLRYYDVVHPVDAVSALTEFDYHAALRQASFLFQAELVESDDLRFERS